MSDRCRTHRTRCCNQCGTPPTPAPDAAHPSDAEVIPSGPGRWMRDDELAAREQAARTDAWDEGAEATADWIANNPLPSGVPTDPPVNPYAQLVKGGA